MGPFLFLLILLPQIEAQRAKVFFHKPGEDAVLPCDFKLSSDLCSSITWGFNAAQGIGGVMVHDGIQSVWGRVMSLDSACSLLINNITAADSGRYFCRMKGSGEEARPAVLNVLTLSSTQADTDSDLVIQCALERPFLRSQCIAKRFRWLEKGTGTVVSGDKIKFSNTSDRCVSSLTLDRGDTKSYTCQYFDGGMQVQVQADYEPSVQDPANPTDPTDPTDPSAPAGDKKAAVEKP